MMINSAQRMVLYALAAGVDITGALQGALDSDHSPRHEKMCACGKIFRHRTKPHCKECHLKTLTEGQPHDL